MYSPRWLFLVPGLLLVLLGLIGYAIALPGLEIGSVRIDVHTLLVASLFLLLGYQSLLFAVFAKTFAIGARLLPNDPRVSRMYDIVTLERGLAAGTLSLATGVVLIAIASWHWYSVDFGSLSYPRTMRWVIPGATLTALGFQTVLSSFFVSILRMQRR